MKGIIKEYLESQARIDECFKAKYNPEHLDYCIDYLYKNAEKLANKEKCVAVNGETVLKWARDYFNDGINVKEEEERNNCLPPENAKIALDLFTNKFIRKSA